MRCCWLYCSGCPPYAFLSVSVCLSSFGFIKFMAVFSMLLLMTLRKILVIVVLSILFLLGLSAAPNGSLLNRCLREHQLLLSLFVLFLSSSLPSSSSSSPSSSSSFSSSPPPPPPLLLIGFNGCTLLASEGFQCAVYIGTCQSYYLSFFCLPSAFLFF